MKAWKNFLILYLMQFLNLLDFISITPLGAILVKNDQLNSADISYAIASYSIAAVIGSVLSTRFKIQNAQRYLAILLAVFLVSQLLLLFPVQSSMFIIAKFVGGLSGGLMGSVAYSLISYIEDGKSSRTWNGRIQTAQSLVTIAGIPVCLALFTTLGSSVYFVATSGCTLIILSMVLTSDFFKVEFPKVSSVERGAIEWDIALTGFFCYLAAYLFISHLANYLINAINVSEFDLSMSYLTSGLIVLALGGWIGKINEHYSSVKLLIISIVLILIPQIGFKILSEPSILLFGLVPLYLLFSNARAIYQRGIIIEKARDSLRLHLLNNTSLRLGILASGLILSSIAWKSDTTARLFETANDLSILANLITIVALVALNILNHRNAKQDT